MTDEARPSGHTRRGVLQAAGAVPFGAFAIDGTVEDAIDKAIAEREAALADVPTSSTPESFAGWQGGDLHSHTSYSHDVCGDPTCENPSSYGYTPPEQIRNAELKDLDYLSITDHNTVAAQNDPGYESDTVTLLDGYEDSLSNGHGGFHGVETVYDEPDETDEEMAALIRRVHRDGGVCVINHPTTSISSTWEYGGPLGADAIEVWNTPWYLRSNRTVIADNNHLALELYDAYLEAGNQLALVGGSDNHRRVLDAFTGVGNPTTWVFAPAGDRQSILDGIKRGRTFVSWDWTGPFLGIDARTAGSDYDLMIGDTGARNGTHIAVKTTVWGAPGHRVRLLVDGDVVAVEPVTTPEFTWETTVKLDQTREQNWIRAELLFERDETMRALTSPIYLTDDGTPVEPVPTDADIDIPEFGEPFVREEQRPADSTGGCECHPPAVRNAFHDIDLTIGGPTGSRL